MRITHLRILFLSCLTTVVTQASGAEKAAVDVGVARIDITPRYPVRLSGYIARKSESNKVAQHIWAKALVIGSDTQGPVVLVSVDNLGVGESMVEDLAARLRKRVNLPRERLTVASSHTHSAPCLTGVVPNIFGVKLADKEQGAIDRYTRELADALEKVCIEALGSRKPSLLSWAQTKVTFAVNRRTKGGPVDHSLPVLKVTSVDGALRSILVNYACHCTTIDPINNAVSGDWAGFAQEAIEADHPGSIAMTVVGCGADSNPANRQDKSAAETHGRAIADAFKVLLSKPWTSLSGPPETAFERFTLPFDTLPDRGALEQQLKAGGASAYAASVQLGKLDRDEPLQTRLHYSAQAWRFGDDLAMVFLPGEVVVDYVVRLKKELDPSRLWVTAYSNDLPCYIPSERILAEGGYEGGGAMIYYGRPTRLKTGVEQTIVDAVHHVVTDRFRPSEAKSADDMPAPLSANDALKAFHIKPGLKVELVAAEPLVLDPVAIDFGTDGKLWVAEMRDYPTGIDGKWTAGGVIKVLEDRDGDGKYETGTEFMKGLPFPTGVMAWRQGVLICAAPEIIYAEDTNGDGKADVRKVLFQGFATENYQARVNGLSYHLDNWVYGANGLIGGTIRGTATGREVSIGGRDFRINPDTGVMQPASGLSQQGRIHDDWGNHFGGNNSILLYHYPLSDHYALRNPRVAAPSPAVFLGDDPDPSLLFPTSKTLARYNHPESANRVTSACGPGIYRDILLGREYVGNAFTCEPVHNLVRRTVLEPDGVTYKGHRAADEQASEFLSSTDPWFRPVQARTAPDGSLWVVDMYRFVIEHPRWISPDKLASLDVRAGADKGRIYRVVREGVPLRSVSRLEGLSTTDLAVAIDTPNGTVRDNIQRLLVHRADRSAAPVLAEIVRTGKNPAARSQALCTLDGLNTVTKEVLLGALNDAEPEVRRQAVRLCEPLFDKEPELIRGVNALIDDPDVRVRFQVALSLGESNNQSTGSILGKMATVHTSDPWVRAAVLSSSSRYAAEILSAVVASANDKEPSPELIEPLLATLLAKHDPAATVNALAAINPIGAKPASWRMGAVAELLDASGQADLSERNSVRTLTTAARQVVINKNANIKERVNAIRLLGRDKTELAADMKQLSERLDPSEPLGVQLAALRSLARLDVPLAFEMIVARWPALGPVVRAAVLDAMLARPSSAEILLSACEANFITPVSVDAAHRQRLLAAGDDALRRRAGRIFNVQAIGPRQAVLKTFAASSNVRGDASRGKTVFARICASCHKFGGVGHEVGPDIAALTDTSFEALSTAILDPNREVDARYATYSVALNDGRVLTGLIASETASAVTLKRQEGQLEVVLRADLEALKTEGRSLMPEGLENDLKPVDLADLVTYMASGATKPKTLDGNSPRTLFQGPDGIVRLPATAAEVYGPTVTFESAFANLGMWHNVADRAAWTFRVEKPSTFTVSMEWACADESAGNPLLLKVGPTTMRTAVAGTGSGTWANYRTIFLCEVTLPAGTHRLDIGPGGPLRNALMDLRAVVLTPRGEGVYRK